VGEGPLVDHRVVVASGALLRAEARPRVVVVAVAVLTTHPVDLPPPVATRPPATLLLPVDPPREIIPQASLPVVGEAVHRRVPPPAEHKGGVTNQAVEVVLPLRQVLEYLQQVGREEVLKPLRLRVLRRHILTARWLLPRLEQPNSSVLTPLQNMVDSVVHPIPRLELVAQDRQADHPLVVAGRVPALH
jgi:hypothetical protein